MRKGGVGFGMGAALMCAAVWLVEPREATATLPIQKSAKALGLPSTNCLYCHAEKLPKKGTAALNERGKWLVAEKDKRRPKEVDAAWLKDYVEKKKVLEKK